MSNVPRIVALALALLCPLSASAHGWPWPNRGVTVSYYAAVPVVAYQPVPILVVPPWLVCPPPQAPAQVAPQFARPTPAPPSAAPVPTPQSPPASSPASPGLPLPPPSSPLNPPPNIRESRSSYYDAFYVAPRTSDKPAGERCAVAFWNLTGRPLTLKLDGQTQVLASGQALTREMGREFVWQIEGHDPQRQTLPAGETGLEIVIRQ